MASSFVLRLATEVRIRRNYQGLDVGDRSVAMGRPTDSKATVWSADVRLPGGMESVEGGVVRLCHQRSRSHTPLDPLEARRVRNRRGGEMLSAVRRTRFERKRRGEFRHGQSVAERAKDRADQIRRCVRISKLIAVSTRPLAAASDCSRTRCDVSA